MAQGAWRRTAAQMAQFARANFKGASRAKPDQFNPYEFTGGSRVRINKQNFGMLKKLFGARKARKP